VDSNGGGARGGAIGSESGEFGRDMPHTPPACVRPTLRLISALAPRGMKLAAVPQNSPCGEQRASRVDVPNTGQANLSVVAGRLGAFDPL
jgi:hypothetical protein